MSLGGCNHAGNDAVMGRIEVKSFRERRVFYVWQIDDRPAVCFDLEVSQGHVLVLELAQQIQQQNLYE